jgi:hypothetical protein
MKGAGHDGEYQNVAYLGNNFRGFCDFVAPGHDVWPVSQGGDSKFARLEPRMGAFKKRL